MESIQPVLETPAKKNQAPLIIAAAAIILCCCCCIILAAAGFYGYITIRSSQTNPPAPIEEAVPVVPADESTSVPFSSPGEAPTGGLGNDVLRKDTWQYVAAAAQGLGCDQPVGADTKIEVLQEPQDGVWQEKWTVACATGDTYPFEITFTLDSAGTTFDIKPLP
jgi:hypothetical protein